MGVQLLDPETSIGTIEEGLTLTTQVEIANRLVAFSVLFRKEEEGYKARAIARQVVLDCLIIKNTKWGTAIAINTGEKVVIVGYIDKGHVHIFKIGINYLAIEA